MLPDHSLLEIFDFYRMIRIDRSRIQWWSLLVHICRRWREIIFGSPLRLNLQIFCTHLTPVKKYLGIWPAFPIVIDYPPRLPFTTRANNVEKNNIITALKHPTRISVIRLHVFGMYGMQATNILKTMKVPFPVLTHLEIDLDWEREPVIPAEFLRGSAPRYRKSYCPAFHIQRYQHFFCRPLTSSSSTFSIYRRMVTFHPTLSLRRWWHFPGSKHLPLDSILPIRLIEYTSFPY